jgi:hypothetical protein
MLWLPICTGRRPEGRPMTRPIWLLWALVGLTFGLLLAGCATLRLTPADYAAFEDEFWATKACTGFVHGQYRDLTIVPMPSHFRCDYYPVSCRGEFVPPATIKLGTVDLWRHEVVHYLLFRNTQDADRDHTSPLFRRCGGG